MFWDVATFGLIERRSQHLVLRRVLRRSSPTPPPRRRTSTTPDDRRADARHPSGAGRRRRRRPLRADPQRDLDRRGHDASCARPAARRRRAGRRRRHVRRRRAAVVDPAEVDVYYFAPQKCFALRRRPVAGAAARRPRVERIERDRRLAAAGSRRRSTSRIALDNSRLDQTYNTPALATLFLLDRAGALDDRRTAASAWCVGALRALGRRSSTAGPSARASRTPFVTDPAEALDRGRHDRPRRASTPSTVAAVLRANGIVDTESLPQARPQPAAHRHVPGRSTPTTSRRSPRCIDHVVERLMA